MIVPLSGIPWALCGCCALRWPITTDRFNVPADDDQELYAYSFEILAEAQMAEPSQSTGVATMKRSTIDPRARFDPWVGQSPTTRGGSNPDDPEAPPTNWFALSAESRGRLGVVLTEDDPPGVKLGPWRRLRARYLKAEDQGEAAAFNELIAPYYITDPIERAKWANVERELSNRSLFPNPTTLIDLATRKLRGKHGKLGALELLRLRRAAIDVEISRLEQQLAVQ